MAVVTSSQAEETARGWLERLNVEEPSEVTLAELRRLLRSSRMEHEAAADWRPLFTQLHGVDALCIWLCRLQAMAPGRGSVAEERLHAMEQLLLCLWEFMNAESGMLAMLSGEGAGVLALAHAWHGAPEANEGLPASELPCNLHYLARCLEVPGSQLAGAAAPATARGLAAQRVQCTAIKLLASAAAFSAEGHKRGAPEAGGAQP